MWRSASSFFIGVVGLTAFRVLMVWVYDRSGESMLVHASYIACALTLTPLALAGVAFLARYLRRGRCAVGAVGQSGIIPPRYAGGFYA